MASPFTDVSVQPFHEPGSVLVSWAVMQPYVDGAFFVYRSLNGAHDWTLLNEFPASGNVFRDEGFPVGMPFAQVHYRILLEYKGDSFDSPVVGINDHLTRQEYAAVYTMLRRELLRMRAGNGVRVFHYTRLADGVLSNYADKDTGQVSGVDCSGSTGDAQGTSFKQGYGQPVQTWLEFLQSGPFVQAVDAEGRQAVKSSQSIKVRMLAFPRPRYLDLIVQPATNDRYVVGEQVQGFFLKGTAAIAYEVQLERVASGDPRQKIEIPTLRPENTAHLMP